MNTLLLLGLGLGGLLLLNKQSPATGVPVQGELTFVNGPITGTPYMVMLGEPSESGRQLVSVYNTNEELLFIYTQNVDGSGKALFNSLPNPNLEKQAEAAVADFGFED